MRKCDIFIFRSSRRDTRRYDLLVTPEGAKKPLRPCLNMTEADLRLELGDMGVPERDVEEMMRIADMRNYSMLADFEIPKHVATQYAARMKRHTA